MSTPRYFVPRSDAAPDELPLMEPDSVVSILGSIRLPTAHGPPAEWVIVRMLSGALVPLPAEDRHLLPPRLLGVLSNHEVAGGRTLELPARSLHLFVIELLEQSPDAPGLDDPVHLYGALTGPFPPRPDAPPCVREGQLTVTRADLLSGLCRGQKSAFLLPPADGTARSARAIGAVLPGDREAAIQAGEGWVLALPLLPAEMAMSDASNEIIVAQLLHDLLAMLRDDARATHPTHPLAQLALPVPSRAALEARLRSEGFTIEGDVATQGVGEQKGFKGVLASVLHPMTAERRLLPPEASLDQLVALAESVLPSIPGWPSPRARALTVHTVASSSLRDASARAAVPRMPTPIEVPSPAPSARAPRPRASTPRDEWMKDFIDAKPAKRPASPSKSPASQSAAKSSASKSPPSKPARLTPTRKAAPEPAIPEWMRDFDTDDHDD